MRFNEWEGKNARRKKKKEKTMPKGISFKRVKQISQRKSLPGAPREPPPHTENTVAMK